jgi:hypothetical protein
MSQRVKDIHRDLIIADQWTEPHSPWQKLAELNGVKYLKSHTQVLLDTTVPPDNLSFLTQDYLSHAHDLNVNHQPNWKIPEQVSRGSGGTSDISHIVMFYWFEPVLYLDLVSLVMFYWFEPVLYLDPVSKFDFQKPQKGLDTL